LKIGKANFSSNDQVRKRGLPPLLRERGRAPLPDLFIAMALIL
jgi:hypothetical protein